MTERKADWVPPEERKLEQVLSPTDLECLDVLVAKGEMLQIIGGNFYQLERLIKTEHAEITREYVVERCLLQLVQPTEKGRHLAAIRQALKKR